MLDRERQGREASPSAAVIDSQSVKAPHSETRGYDAGKKIVGRKRHIAVDTDGRLLMVNLTTADISDSAGAQAILEDADALKVDFQGAIQGPYNQALTCAELIRGGATCTTKDGKKLTFPLIARSFPIVILSDPFPASTILSRSLLERGDDTAPV